MAQVQFVELLHVLELSGQQHALIVGAIIERMCRPGFGTGDSPLAE